MPNIDWHVAHSLVTPFATVDFNATDGATGRRYQILPESYKIVPAMRATQDNISQRSGSTLHPKYKSGLVATMRVRYEVWTPATDQGNAGPACDSDLRAMHETLTGALESILSVSGSTQRLIWTPPGYGDDRMLEGIQTLAWTEPEYEDDEFAVVTFAVECAFPYAIDYTQISTDISGAGTLANAGNANFLPVAQVHGGFTTFQLKNNSVLDPDGNPVELNYDGTRPGAVTVGGGDYAEIDFWQGSIFLNGSSTDLTPGLVPATSDFWFLAPGANSIDTDHNTTFLYNGAWA